MYAECIYYIYYLLFWLVFASVVRKYKSYSLARAEPRSNQKTGERGGEQGLMHCLHSTPREFGHSVHQRTGQSTFLTGRQGVSGYKGIPSVVFLLATSYLIRVIFVRRTTLYLKRFKIKVKWTKKRHSLFWRYPIFPHWYGPYIPSWLVHCQCFTFKRCKKNSKWNVLVMEVCMVRIILEKLDQNSECCYADFRPVRRPGSS